MSDTHANVVVSVIDKASGILGGIGKAVAGIAMAAGAAAIGVGIASVKMAADFESTMNMFGSVAGQSLGAAGMNVKDFSELALKLGADTKFSAQEAGDAMVNLAKGGVDMKSIMTDATKATLDLAAAAGGNLGLAEAADIVAKQLGVWGSTGTTATQISNLLAQAANASSTDVQGLALGLANVGGVAKSSGVSFEDLVKTLAGIAPQFSSSAEAGTSLKSMLLAIADPSKDAKGAMRELGLMTFDYAKAQAYLAKQGVKTDGSARQINVALEKLTKSFKMSKKDATAFFASFEQNQFYDSEGKFLGMANMAEKLKTALAGLSDQDKSKALGDMFGSFGINAASALAAMGNAGFDKMADGMTKAGTAAEQAALMQKGFNASLESMKGSVDTVMIRLGTLLLPILTRIVTEGLTPLINGIGDFIGALSSSDNPMKTLHDMLEKTFGSDVAKTVSDVVLAVQTLVTTLSGGGNLGDFGEKLKSLTTSDLGKFVGDIAIKLQSAIDWVKTNWPQIKETITSVFTDVSNFIGTKVIPIGTTIIAAFAAAVQWVITNWPQISETIGKVGSTVGSILNILSLQVTWLLGIFQEIVGWVTTNWPLIAKTFENGMPLWKGILGALVIAFVTTWEMIKVSISNIVTIILGLLKAAMQLMQGDTEGALNTLHEMFKTIFNRILEAIKTVLRLIFPNFDETFGKIKTFLGDLPATFYTLGKNIVTGLLNAIIDFGGTVKDKIIEMIMGPLGYVKGLLGIHSPSDEMMWVGQMIGAGLAIGINSSIGTVKAAMQSLHDAAIAPMLAPDVGPQGTAQVNWAGAAYNNGSAGANNITNIDMGGVNVASNVDANWFLRQLGETLLRHP